MEENTQLSYSITVLAPIIEKYVFCKPLRGDEARDVHDEVKIRVESDFKDVPAFNAYFEFNEKTGEINGSSSVYGILINQVLEEKGLWLPTIVQAMKIESNVGFFRGVYRDFGLSVYNEEQPNRKVAKRMIEESKRRGWNMPILMSFRNLGVKKGDDLLGVDITIENDNGIMTGDEARQYIDDNFDYKEDSGACGVFRSEFGTWNAYTDGLDDSDSVGRVDFVCGEATEKDLEKIILTDIDKIGQREADKLNKKIYNARKKAIRILRT